MSAADNDSGLDGSITYTMENVDSAIFIINSQTGWITLNCSACLDFDVTSSYVPMVRAIDGKYL